MRQAHVRRRILAAFGEWHDMVNGRRLRVRHGLGHGDPLVTDAAVVPVAGGYVGELVPLGGPCATLPGFPPAPALPDYLAGISIPAIVTLLALQRNPLATRAVAFPLVHSPRVTGPGRFAGTVNGTSTTTVPGGEELVAPDALADLNRTGWPAFPPRLSTPAESPIAPLQFQPACPVTCPLLAVGGVVLGTADLTRAPGSCHCGTAEPAVGTVPGAVDLSLPGERAAACCT